MMIEAVKFYFCIHTATGRKLCDSLPHIFVFVFPLMLPQGQLVWVGSKACMLHIFINILR